MSVFCVTGGTGFIGKNLTHLLTAMGHDVRILSRSNAHQPIGKVSYFYLDLLDSTADFSEFLFEADVLINCAGELQDEAKMSALHIEAVARLIDAVKKTFSLTKHPLHWVQLSSCGVYGASSHFKADKTKIIVTESFPATPVGIYEITKLASENLVRRNMTGEHFTYSILRPSNVFGKNMPNKSLFRLISAIKSGYFFYLGRQEVISTYVHVDDVSRALLLLSIDGRAPGEIYNLSNSCSLKSLVECISRLFKKTSAPVHLPTRLVMSAWHFASVVVRPWRRLPSLNFLISSVSYPATKIKRDLDFTFSRAMPDSISELIGANVK